MKLANRHIIRRLFLDVNYQGNGWTSQWVNELREHLCQEVLPALSEHLDQTLPSRTYFRIKQMDIHLNIDLRSNWKTQLKSGLLKEFIQAYSKLIASSELIQSVPASKARLESPFAAYSSSLKKAEGVQKMSLQDVEWQRFIFYLENGYLPWWSERPTQQKWEEELIESLEKSQQVKWEELITVLKNSYSRDRFLIQFSDRFQLKLSELLFLQRPESIAPEVKNWLHTHIISISQRNRYSIWECLWLTSLHLDEANPSFWHVVKKILREERKMNSRSADFTSFDKQDYNGGAERRFSGKAEPFLKRDSQKSEQNQEDGFSTGEQRLIFPSFNGKLEQKEKKTDFGRLEKRAGLEDNVSKKISAYEKKDTPLPKSNEEYLLKIDKADRMRLDDQEEDISEKQRRNPKQTESKEDYPVLNKSPTSTSQFHKPLQPDQETIGNENVLERKEKKQLSRQENEEETNTDFDKVEQKSHSASENERIPYVDSNKQQIQQADEQQIQQADKQEDQQEIREELSSPTGQTPDTRRRSQGEEVSDFSSLEESEQSDHLSAPEMGADVLLPRTDIPIGETEILHISDQQVTSHTEMEWGKDPALNDAVEMPLHKPLNYDSGSSFPAEGLEVPFAGLVLLNPFLQTFFSNLNLLEGKDFKTHMERQRAVQLLAYLASGQEQLPEYKLMICKILCGWPLHTPPGPFAALTKTEKDESESLLRAVLEHWVQLKGTTPDQLAISFLNRTGKLKRLDKQSWQLDIYPASFDVLLEVLPWSFSLIRLSWMTGMMYTNWKVI